MLSNNPLTTQYSSIHEGAVTVYMIAPTGRIARQGTLAREFNKDFFKEIAEDLCYQKKFFFKDRTDAQDCHLIHSRAGLYELKLPKTVCLDEDKKEPGQLKIDTSQITVESIQNVTVIESGTYKRYTISNPHNTGTEVPVIETSSPLQFSSKYILKNGK